MLMLMLMLMLIMSCDSDVVHRIKHCADVSSCHVVSKQYSIISYFGFRFTAECKQIGLKETEAARATIPQLMHGIMRQQEN